MKDVSIFSTNSNLIYYITYQAKELFQLTTFVPDNLKKKDSILSIKYLGWPWTGEQ